MTCVISMIFFFHINHLFFKNLINEPQMTVIRQKHSCFLISSSSTPQEKEKDVSLTRPSADCMVFSKACHSIKSFTMIQMSDITYNLECINASIDCEHKRFISVVTDTGYFTDKKAQNLLSFFCKNSEFAQIGKLNSVHAT